MTFILSNITLVSKDFYQKNIGKYKDYPPDWFLDKFVKKTFKENDIVEHMWVKINEVKDNILIGELNNDPVAIMSMRLKDKVEVKTEEILCYLLEGE